MRPSPPVIGVDARAAAEVPAGRGRYVREIVRALIDQGADLRLYGRRPWPLPGSRWRLLGTREPLWGAHAALLAGRECDILLACNSYLMAAGRAPAVPVVFDLFGMDRRHGLPASARAERLTLPVSLLRARGFICISQATRRELEHRFPVTAGRTTVIPLGVGPEFIAARPSGAAARHGLNAPFVLAVATREPRKNLSRLIEAFCSLSPAIVGDTQLALAGAPGWGGELGALPSGHANRIRRLGFVADADLPSLYAEAMLFAYPSLEEGFGLPVLEAMAAGTAVLTSDRSSLPEVAGDAALLVDPTDTTAIAAGLGQLLGDHARRAELARRGRERAAGFTWERTARETLAFLGGAAAG